VATNATIKKALLGKLGVTPQRLSQLVSVRKKQLPMTTEQAVYTIAHENGIDIARSITSEELAVTQQILRDLANLTSGMASRGAPCKEDAKRTSPRRATISVKGDALATMLGVASVRVDEAKSMAERVYPRLYLFENSLRDVIERVLKFSYGDDWWSKRVPKRVRDVAEKHRADEASDPWHGKRGAREIDYTLLTHLWKIIEHNWKDFANLFPNQAWIEGLVTNDMNVSRRVIAHMNPIENDDIKNIEAAYRKWAKQRNAIEKSLP